MKFVILSITVLSACCFGLLAQGKDEGKLVINAPSEAALKKIAASEEKERLEILRQLEKDRLDLQAQLFKELGAATENDKKFVFVYLMGFYRLEGTVWTLAKIIDLEAKPALNDALPRWGRHPAVDALVRIGRPAIPAMLANIKDAKGEKITELSVKVIQYAETPSIAKMILEEAVAKEEEPAKKKLLQDSLKFLKKD